MEFRPIIRYYSDWGAPEDYSCTVHIGPVVSEEKIEMWRTKETDNGCQKYGMTKAHLDFSQVYYIFLYKHILFAKYRTKWIRHKLI